MMKNTSGLKLTLLVVFISLLFAVNSVFAADDEGVIGDIPNIFDMFGLGFLFTKEIFLMLAAAVSISAFIVTFLEWLGMFDSKHYKRNLLSFSFVGLFVMMALGIKMQYLVATYGFLFFMAMGILFFIGIVGALYVKHYHNKKAWQTDKLETDLQKDEFKATKGIVVGMVDELQKVRSDLKDQRDIYQTNMVYLTKKITPEAQAKCQANIAKISERIKDLESEEMRILKVQEAMKKKFEKSVEDNIDTIVN